MLATFTVDLCLLMLHPVFFAVIDMCVCYVSQRLLTDNQVKTESHFNNEDATAYVSFILIIRVKRETYHLVQFIYYHSYHHRFYFIRPFLDWKQIA